MQSNVSQLAEIDPSTGVLLLGSGFSLECTNLYGKPPPNGAGLRRHFSEQLKLPPDNAYDLQVLAEEFASENQANLYHELYNLFHVTAVGIHQEAVLREPWLRIYTTNYDDSVETCYLNNIKRHADSYTSSDPLPNRLQRNSVVHLHGSIGRLSEDNVLEQLVLGETSYVRQYVSKSPWYTQFQVDIKFASNLFIIGYSLSDYHISALLLENPLLADRTLFVQSSRPDPILDRRTSKYGNVLRTETKGFAELIRTTPRAKPQTDPTKLKSFRALVPLRDRKSVRPPTSMEILNLLVFGTFNYLRCAATLPEESYVVSRRAKIDEFLKLIEASKSVIVDSRLGNGKTIFLYLAFLALAERGYSCFLFKSAGPGFEQELSTLNSVKKAVIMFQEYTSAQDVIQTIADRLPNAKFVIEIRTSIFEVRYHEVQGGVPKPYNRVGLNQFSSDDLLAFRELCRHAGISTAGMIEKAHNIELRELLLQLLESPNIEEKIDSTIRPIFQSPARRKVLLLSMLLSKFHVSADAGFIRSVTGVDPYHEFRPVQEIAEELFETGLDDFHVRSAIFSDFAVRSILESGEISDCVFDAVLAAAIRKEDRRYRVVMSSLMRYWNLADLFRSELDANEIIVSLYERLRYDERINVEPLFWLEYSIAAAESGELLLAENFIETSYERASHLEGFRTFQIDTHSCRILLLIETQAPIGHPVERIQKILDKLELLNSMLIEESHRSYAVRVLESIGPFLQRRRNDLSGPEKTALMFWLSQLVETLGGLPAEYRAREGSDMIKEKLEMGKQLLL